MAAKMAISFLADVIESSIFGHLPQRFTDHILVSHRGSVPRMRSHGKPPVGRLSQTIPDGKSVRPDLDPPGLEPGT